MNLRLVESGRNGHVIIQSFIPLAPEQLKKLECKELEERINNLARDKDIVGWSVEKEQNSPVSVIDMEIPYPVENEKMLDVEMNHIKFLEAVCNMDIPKPLPKENHDQPLINFDNAEDDGTLQYVKDFLNDLNLPQNKEGRIFGTFFFSSSFLPTGEVTIEASLMREFCELYIKAHE